MDTTLFKQMYRADVPFTLFTVGKLTQQVPARLYAMGISLADQLYQALMGSEVQVKLVDVQVKKMHASIGALNT